MKFVATFVTISQLLLAACDARSLVKDFHKAPRGWENVGRAPADHVLNLRIGLTQGNFQELHRQLYEVSDPQHARYGQHLSQEQVNDLVRPKSETLETIEEWLENVGLDGSIIKYNVAKTWITFPISVAEAEALLDTEYSIWQHDDGSVLVRTESWALPEHLHSHVTTIQPTNSWARLQRQVPVQEIKGLKNRANHHKADWAPWSSAASSPTSSSPAGPTGTSGANPAAVSAACNFTAVTPDCLRTLYGTIDYTPATDSGSEYGVCNYLGEYNNRSDTFQFLSMYRPEAANYAYQFPEISIADGVVDNGTQHADDGTGLEGNLDIQYVIGIGYPLPVTAWGTGGSDPTYIPDLGTPTNSDEPYLTWAQYILSQKDIPKMISTSYGDDEQTISLAYAQTVCNEFAQLGALGVSMLFSSGDDGIGANGTCYSSADNTTYEFLPAFPASCPYVTAVGGTRDFPEVAMYAPSHKSGLVYASGAGFSNYFSMPGYQQDAVGAYVTGLNGLYDGYYNKSGRAYPDIACIAQYFPIIWNGSTVLLLGTSGASPTCAGVLGLVNDALLAAGRPSLGFLNPWLYGGGYKAFTDITSGSSLGCNVTGFPATAGWDAVTGYGSPYFPNIVSALGL